MPHARNACCSALAAIGALTAIFGLSFAFFYDSAAYGSSRDGVNLAFWGEPVVDPVLRAYQHWIHAVLGSTMAGWGVTIAALAHIPLRRGVTWAWWTLTAAIAIWTVFDTTASLHFSVGSNVLLNAVATVALAAPLVPLFPRAMSGSPGG